MNEKPPAPKPRPPFRPRSRRWKWVLGIAVSLLLVFACHFGYGLASREWTRRQGERELAAVRTQIEQTDPDWTWERLNANRARPPAGQNSADLIPRIKKLSHEDWGKELAKEEWKPRLEVPPNVRYSPSVLAQVRRELASSAEAVKLARTLKDYPRGNRDIHLAPNVLDTLLQDTQDTRHAGDVLRWDVVVAVEERNDNRAVEDLQAILNASRSIGDEPFLISQLVRIAVRSVALRSTEWLLAQTAEAPGLTELQESLAEDTEEPLLLYGVRGDRAAFDKLFANLDSGETTPDQAIDRGFRDWQARLGWWYYRGHLPADRAFALDWMTRYVEAASLPIHEQQTAVATIPDPVKDPTRLLSGLLLPAVDKVANAHWRTTAEARCAVVGVVCERFRQKNGRWPNDLAELTPAFIAAIPLDPYDGQPLRLAKLEDGIVIHSIGRFDPEASVKALNRRAELPEGVDFGFRLWDPDRRRLPPPDPVAPLPEVEQQP